MSPASPTSSSHSPQPQARFLVFHHYQAELVRSTIIGIYSSLQAAQNAAAAVLEEQLAKCVQAGLSGRVYRVIDLELKGLITAVTDQGEKPLSEFEIRQEHVVQVTPTDQLLGTLMPLLPTSSPASPSSSTLIPASQLAKSKQVHPAEKDPLWAQSRVPLFRRRDERLFRDSCMTGLHTDIERHSPSPNTQRGLLPFAVNAAPVVQGQKIASALDDGQAEFRALTRKREPGKVQILRRLDRETVE
ncbi:unnamed protein product [Periconia digitata]|uniref:Uncharacterized protein n=1 Tax=Periconia digitata TaxID=1303443 RepID=A0A9W4USG7_9PLEO|nr:unnamed protein product [Periconia digitata]